MISLMQSFNFFSVEEDAVHQNLVKSQSLSYFQCFQLPWSNNLRWHKLYEYRIISMKFKLANVATKLRYLCNNKCITYYVCRLNCVSIAYVTGRDNGNARTKFKFTNQRQDKLNCTVQNCIILFSGLIPNRGARLFMSATLARSHQDLNLFRIRQESPLHAWFIHRGRYTGERYKDVD